MKAMQGGNYEAAVQGTVLPEWLSMNAQMAGIDAAKKKPFTTAA